MNCKIVYMGLAALALPLATVLPAASQQAMPPAPPAMRGPAPLAQFDTNQDGAVTQAEIDTMRSDRLKQFDKNADGKLNLEEYQALWLDAYRTQMVRAFQGHDIDGDAAVTIQEFNRNFANIVGHADRNGDAKVDAQDMVGPQVPPPQARDRGRDDDRRGPGPDMRRPGPQQQPGPAPQQQRGRGA